MILVALFCVKEVVVLFNIKFIAGLAFQIHLHQGRTFAQVAYIVVKNLVTLHCLFRKALKLELVMLAVSAFVQL